MSNEKIVKATKKKKKRNLGNPVKTVKNTRKKSIAIPQTSFLPPIINGLTRASSIESLVA